jgi:hypothetical protein
MGFGKDTEQLGFTDKIRTLEKLTSLSLPADRSIIILYQWFRIIGSKNGRYYHCC